jgi:prepilin-type N-terminal cleavage/methylation domain-containing protein
MRRSRGDARGFTLLELLVALAIVVALLLGATGIHVQQKNVAQRMAAQRAADRELENVYERIRYAPPLDGTILPPSEPGGPTIHVAVSEGTVPGTWKVELVASYRVQNHPFRRTLVALVRP